MQETADSAPAVEFLSGVLGGNREEAMTICTERGFLTVLTHHLKPQIEKILRACGQETLAVSSGEIVTDPMDQVITVTIRIRFRPRQQA